MPRRKSTDVPIGTVITDRLEEMERSQPWLARKANCSVNTISFIIKGIFRPSNNLIERIASVLLIDPAILAEARKKGDYNGYRNK